MKLFSSSVLKNSVELTSESEIHILSVHPEMKPYLRSLSGILKSPDEVRVSKIDPKTLLFYKRFGIIKTQKFLVVVVKTSSIRNFIITFYITDKIKIGEKY